MFCEVSINTVKSVKRMGFNECTGILKENKLYYCEGLEL